MSSNVNWFVLEEEYTIGFATIGGKDVFITEESIRFDAPLVKIHETLSEAVMQVCSLDEDDLGIPEERRYFKRTMKEALKNYRIAKKG